MEQYQNEKYNANCISEGVEIMDRQKTCYEIMSENFLKIGGAQQFSSSINTKRITLR